ncbi:hypothetical protein ES703_119865 [subsurface metagenome]
MNVDYRQTAHDYKRYLWKLPYTINKTVWLGLPFFIFVLVLYVLIDVLLAHLVVKRFRSGYNSAADMGWWY